MSDPRVESAEARFRAGTNCAQSVFSAFAPELGIDEQTALRLAAPFGGGMGRRGEVCGAVSGALLALGMRYGHVDPAGRERTYAVAREFLARFEQDRGSLRCRDLTGVDMLDPDAYQQAKAAGRFPQVCPFAVRAAAGILADMLANPPHGA